MDHPRLVPFQLRPGNRQRVMELVETTLIIAASFLIGIATTGIVVWTAGAIYFDIAGTGRWAWPLVAGWVVAIVLAFVLWQPIWQPFLGLTATFGLFLGWWLSQRPSHDRNWNRNATHLPRVDWDGDRFTVVNFRNTVYRSIEDFDPHFETRSFNLSNLCGLDILISFWGSPWMCHPILIFDFGPDGRICASIEVRYRHGQKYNFWRSVYRQQELVYVVCDERDAILRRTLPCDKQVCYLYAMTVQLHEIREVFLEYVETINVLFDRPRWYHGVAANCTTSFYRQRKGKERLSWKLLVNGQLDRSLHERRLLDQTCSFEQLKARSQINEIANRAPREGFGDFIRHELRQQAGGTPSTPHHSD